MLGHMDGSEVKGRNQKQWVDHVRKDPQFAGLHSYGGGDSRHGRLEGCHRMSAATKLIRGAESA
jgi:hypothetical protein